MSAKLNMNEYGLFLFKLIPGDNDKLSVLPASTTGSLSSIITTSIASSEPEGANRRGGAGDGDGAADGVGGDSFGGDDAKQIVDLPGIKHEKWWQITLQVSIPFFIAGMGTIAAGIILGRVEVSCWR
jgi:solute carrier family 41